MAGRKKGSVPLKWKAGVKHPITGKAVGGRVMSKSERSVFKTDGHLRKGKRKADYKKSSTKRKPSAKKVSTRKRNPGVSKVKISQTRKTAPGGWKSSMGPYVIVTMKGNMIKGGSFKSLDAAKKKLASLRKDGRKGLKLVKVSLSKKPSASKKRNPSKARKVVRRRRAATPKRRRRRRNAGGAKTVSKSKLRSMMKKLGL